MTHISLTDFVDIVSLSGRPKATKVRQIKRREPYDPATDFYRRVRDAIVEAHQNNLDKDLIDDVLPTLTDPKKITAYPIILKGYKKWWGRKAPAWFEPPSRIYSNFSVDISVNPELGLEIDGIPYLIKLYFKSKPLEKNKIDIITHLMSITLSELCPSPKSTKMSVLDVRRAKLISPTVPFRGLTSMVDAELSYISTLWEES